jgi:hypothetical protein
MENGKLMSFIILLTLVVAISGQDYLVGLNIDPTLISGTNSAITTLKNSLY